jgi:methionyl-tRNA formyltransferase
MAGDERTGVSIIRLTIGLDAGPVCAQTPESIASTDSYGSLAGRLAELGGELLVGTLDGRPQCTEQNEALATYADKITPEDRRLDPIRPASELERVVRALHPHIGAWAELPDGSRLGVLEARALPGSSRPGELVVGAGRPPALGCAEGELELRLVRPPGRRAMSGEEWLRGWRG